VISDVEKPVTGNNGLLVKVHATTVNRTDCAYRAARPFFMRFLTGLIRPRPAVLGTEFAGVVEAVGSGVTSFGVGDKVFGYNEGPFGACQATLPGFAGGARPGEDADAPTSHLQTDLANGFANSRSGQPRIQLDQATRPRTPGSRPVRRLRIDLDGRNLATDKTVVPARAVLELIAQGLHDEAITRRAGISATTVRRHKTDSRAVPWRSDHHVVIMLACDLKAPVVARHP
jgi:hypothetical protein